MKYQLRIRPVEAEQFLLKDRKKWLANTHINYVPASSDDANIFAPSFAEAFNLYREPTSRKTFIATLKDGDWVITHDDGMIAVMSDWDFKKKYEAVNVTSTE